MNEIYEQFYNITQIKPYIIPLKMELIQDWMRSPLFSSVYTVLGRYWLKPEWVVQEAMNVTCDPENLGFADLSVTPVSFGHKAHEYVSDIYWAYNSHYETNRDGLNA